MAVPLSRPLPTFWTVKVSCLVLPTPTSPKFRALGETASTGLGGEAPNPWFVLEGECVFVCAKANPHVINCVATRVPQMALFILVRGWSCLADFGLAGQPQTPPPQNPPRISGLCSVLGFRSISLRPVRIMPGLSGSLSRKGHAHGDGGPLVWHGHHLAGSPQNRSPFPYIREADAFPFPSGRLDRMGVEAAPIILDS